MNNKSHAQALVDSGILDSRPHSFKVIADQGIKEYWWSEAVKQKVKGKRQEAGTEATAELKDNEYAEVTASLETPVTATPQKVPRQQKPARVETADEKAVKDSNASFQTALRALKSKQDATHTYIGKQKEYCKRLTEKGYPESMSQFYVDALAAVEAALAASKVVYGDHAVLCKFSEVVKAKAGEEALKSSSDKLEQQKAAYEKGLGKDLAKIAV